MRDENGQISGYLFGQDTRIGPWVMRQPDKAENLFQAALSLPYQAAPSLAVPSVNPVAGDILHKYHFEKVRANLHMLRGTGGLPGDRRLIFAQASMALG